MSWQCFLLEPTEEVSVELRRYVSRSVDHCEEHRHGYHNASVEIARGHPSQVDLPTLDPYRLEKVLREPPPDDRWPDACPACGRPFRDGGKWQVNVRTLYRPAPDQELSERIDPEGRWTLQDPPIGAMWDADWMSDKGPDGRSLYVILPDGHRWFIDGKATNGPGWERTGQPPDITAQPSIGSPSPSGSGHSYHGWLRDGVLSDPLSDSKMDRER